ncbi:MAG: GDP-mannose 4,6-dehydratase [Actinomycetota bacterium]
MSKAFVVTGGAGFIGSHVVDSLLSDGSNVIVVDDLSSGDKSRLSDDASLEIVDITEPAAVDRVVDACRPSGIFHLAAQSSVTMSVADPGRDCAVNVQGTLNILEASKRHGAPVVFTSTGGALYGNEAPMPTPEDRIPAPVAPYGASKWAGEAYVNSWAEATGIPHTVCRLGNVYGPRQSPHGEAGVVAIFSHQLWTGSSPALFGHGEPTRDYIHVSDVVTAMRMALGTRGTFNVATGKETSVAELYGFLQDASGRRLEPELKPLRAGELERSCMDPARARKFLGWRAETELDKGVAETYQALVREFEAER